MEGRKWEDLSIDILVNVLGRVGMESLLLDVPFVCKSWYKASREPQCWEHLIFPTYIKPYSGFNCWEDIWWEPEIPDWRFIKRLAMTYQENLSVTAFVKFIVNRSCGDATIIELPGGCTEEALAYVAYKCPRLKSLAVGSYNEYINGIIVKFISRWKNLEMLKLGKYHLKEIIPQIGLHCHNLIWLSSPYTYIGKEEASALVSSLSELKYLDLHGGDFEKEALVMILQGCKQLVHLDISKSFGFNDDDAEILELASQIPEFMCEGSMVIHVIEPSSLHDPRLDHELFCKNNQYDCVYDLNFDFE